MIEIRCQRCDALLFKAGGQIKVEIKCRNCKYINKIKVDCEKERIMIEGMLKQIYTPVVIARVAHDVESFGKFPKH